MRRAPVFFYVSISGLILLVALGIIFAGPAARAQEQDASAEFVANLSSGRVILCVTRDAMLVGAASESTEPGSHSPLFVNMNGGHVVVLLGATEWIELNSGKPPVRMDSELAAIRNVGARQSVALEQNEAGEIEDIGIAFLERFRIVAARLHHELALKPDEPVIQLLVAGYTKGYGPEAWLLSYRVRQRELRDNYFDTQALRPSYVQLYPPEKTAPHTLVEVRYPPDIPGPTLLELLGQNDARLRPIRSADPKVALAAQQILDGAAPKAAGDSTTAFLRDALTATKSKDSKLTLAALHDNDHFEWVIPPPEPLRKPSDEKRDPTAPSLRAPHIDH
jgi:hypothetical protein